MLLTLFLASPIRPYARLFLRNLSGSLAVLIVIHVLTLFAAIQHALLSHPQIAIFDVFGSSESTFINAYTQFYELIGMFLFVLTLWFFYMATYVSRRTSAAKTALALQGIKKKAP
ncbi:MAG: hypothetical protein JSW58_01170 [Candidatus Latescibacterota bacterium]|nr:MAG: hypothetical protein JSW58_01170 [Candidatus Latescibacterota bacterium]